MPFLFLNLINNNFTQYRLDFYYKMIIILLSFNLNCLLILSSSETGVLDGLDGGQAGSVAAPRGWRYPR